MSDIQVLFDFYNNNFSSTIDTFEKCSFDKTNKKYLCHSQTKCFNFDKVKNLIFCGEDTCCSVDSLYFDVPNNIIYFIEFKNGKINKEKKNVIKSCRESYIINRFISTFSNVVDIHSIKYCSLLVASEFKNSTIFQTLDLIARAGTGDIPPSVEKIGKELKNYPYYGETLFFSEFEVYSENQFDSKF